VEAPQPFYLQVISTVLSLRYAVTVFSSIPSFFEFVCLFVCLFRGEMPVFEEATTSKPLAKKYHLQISALFKGMAYLFVK